MTDATVTNDAAADRALKHKHRAMWASGDYATVAADLTFGIGRLLVQAAGVREGDRVLDVAAGTGAVAIPAARAGAHVVAADLTPELLEAGRIRAHAENLDIQWEEADAETLPYADHAFDTVLSSIGAMFAPHHRRVADELVRTCRPGGTIGLLAWTPAGFIGQLMAAVKPYLPAPPPGVQPPLLWGREEHVRELFGTRIHDVHVRTQHTRVEQFADGEAFREYFKAKYGPLIGAYRHLGEDAERVMALDRDLADLARRHDLGNGAMDWEYLLFTARVTT